MIPYLISYKFDLDRLKTSDGKYLFSNDNLALYVQSSSPSLPDNIGIGVLGETISCVAKYNPSGYDELELTYPVTGSLYSSIELRCVIVAQLDIRRKNQAYRIYKITKPIDGVITVNARHIAYDLMGIVIAPFTAPNLSLALSGIKSNAMSACPFTFRTTRTAVDIPFEVKVPTQAWTLMGTGDDYLVGRYNGEYLFDNYIVNFEETIGQNNGVKAVYGVNLTDFKQEKACDECYTGVVGYWQNDDDVIYTDVIGTGGQYSYVRIMTVDMSSYWDDKPSITTLTNMVREYIQANDIGVPKVSWTINYIPLSSTEEYKDLVGIDKVSIGDTVYVEFSKIGITASSRVIEMEWDVLLERYKSLSLGDVKDTLPSTIARTISSLASKPDKKTVQTIAQEISEKLTKAMMGAVGGSVRFLDTDGDGEPDTLYIADNRNPNLARKVWRFNYLGWAASENGYNGPFKMGATLDDGFLAEFITAANLTAGIIQSRDGVNYWNLDTGDFRLSAGTMVGTGGQTLNDLASKSAIIAEVDVQYASGTSNTTAPTTGWSTNAPQWQSGRYIWSRTKTVDGNGNVSYSDPTCIQGAAGGQGDTGVGVSAIVEQYYLSTSNTARSGGSWSTNQPQWEEGKYIWTRSKITWTDNTTTYTDPVLAKAINGANEAVATLDSSLDQTGVFNRLTNNGEIQGLYMENGQLYINASYIKSGTLSVGGVNNGKGQIYIYDSNDALKGQIMAALANPATGQIEGVGFSLWEQNQNNKPTGRMIHVTNDHIFFYYAYIDPNNSNNILCDNLGEFEIYTPTTGDPYLVLSVGAGSNQIVLNGSTGRIDCKSLYVNGRQIT